jgi:hypothetical protein
MNLSGLVASSLLYAWRFIMASGTENLLSLLFEEGRELVNFRFFPGENVASAEDLCGASFDALRLALDSDEDTIPGITRPQIQIGELVTKL